VKDAKGQCIESVRLIKVIDMKKLFVLMALFAFTAPAFAGACWVNGEKVGSCQGSDCCGDGEWVPDGGDGNQWQGQAQGQFQFQGQAQGQAQSQEANANATAVAGAVAVNENTNLNANMTNVNVQNDVNNTNTNTASVGDVTANGGEGGDASATATIAEGAVVVNNNTERGAYATSYSSNYAYTEARQAPSVAQGSFAISGCSVGGNAGGSNIHGSAFLGFGWTPQECYKFMLAQAYQSIGEKKAVCDILKNTKVGRRLERDGVELPECVEQVVVIATPVAPDMSKFATKEEVNEKVDRAFRASQTK